MSNPYASPTADLSAGSFGDDTVEPTVFALSGRIGRVRYLAYSIGLSMLFGLLISMIGGGIIAGSGGDSGMLALVTLLAYVPMLAIAVIMSIRRLNDMDVVGWFSLLSLVPIVNIFFGLWLVFGRGTQGTNRYGSAPTKNSGGAIAVACIIPAVALIGILAAIAIPAYQSYVIKAKAAQTQQAAPAPAENAGE